MKKVIQRLQVENEALRKRAAKKHQTDTREEEEREKLRVRQNCETTPLPCSLGYLDKGEVERLKQSLVVLEAGDEEEGVGRVIAENEKLRSDLRKVQMCACVCEGVSHVILLTVFAE